MDFETINHLTVLELLDHGVYHVEGEASGYTISKVIKGRYVDVEEDLAKHNIDGAAIYVQVQGGEDRGNRFIKRVRWLFADFDDHANLPDLPFQPHLVIRTRRGFHVYWAIRPTDRFDLWKAVMRKMCRALGSCDGVVNISQCMRVAGFDHHKGEPFRVEIFSWDPNRKPYRLDEFAHHFGAIVCNEVNTEHYVARHGIWDFRLRRYWLATLLKKLRAAQPGNRFTTLREVAFQLGCFAAVGVSPKIAITKMQEIVSEWEGRNRAHDFRSISVCFDQGYAEGLVRPPITPPEQVKAFIRQDNQTAFEERLTALATAGKLGPRVTVENLMRSYPEWRDAYSAEGSARRGIAKHLRRLGFTEKRSKSARFFVLESGDFAP